MRDRYIRTVLTLILIAVSGIAIALWRPAFNSLAGLLGPRPAEAQKRASVPKAWGKLVGGASNVMYFEAADGTVRVAFYTFGGQDGVEEKIVIARN